MSLRQRQRKIAADEGMESAEGHPGTHMNETPLQNASHVLSKDGTRIGYLSVGEGPSVLVIPGVLSVAADYAAFARALSEHFSVHTSSAGDEARAARKVMITASSKSVRTCSRCRPRRARPFLLGTATVDWLSLEVARNNKAFKRIAVYEPGVSIDGSMPTAWMPGYEKMLAEKRNLDALVEFTLADAPRGIQKTPRWLMKLILLVLISCSRQYRQMLDLLNQHLRECREIARLDSSCEHYREIAGGVLLMYGGKSDSKAVTLAVERLAAILPRSETREFPRLDHFGIERTAPREVAKAVTDYFLK